MVADFPSPQNSPFDASDAASQAHEDWQGYFDGPEGSSQAKVDWGRSVTTPKGPMTLAAIRDELERDASETFAKLAEENYFAESNPLLVAQVEQAVRKETMDKIAEEKDLSRDLVDLIINSEREL